MFIRHTHEAQEVDEDTFFNSPETGGTVVSTALEEMAARRRRALRPRFVEHLRRAGLGRRQHRSDNDKTAALLRERILPVCQYYAYLEVGRDAEHFPPGFIRRDSDLWRTYAAICKSGAPMAMRKVGHRRDIYPVFRELFAKKQATTGAETA